MAVITFSQEFGSGGRDIAKRVAEQTGYFFADKGIIGDLLAQYGLVGFQRIYDSAPAFWESFDSQKMEQRKITIGMMNRVILAIAQRDRAVIVGRGGYLALAGYADVINVRIGASFDTRVARTMREQNIADLAQAESLVRTNDLKREAFMESTYGTRRERACDFNIVLDVDMVPASRAVPLIVGAAKELKKSKAITGKRVGSIAVEPVLHNVIEGIFAA